MPENDTAKPTLTSEASKTTNAVELILGSHHFIDKSDPKQRVWNGHQSRPYEETNPGLAYNRMTERWKSEGGQLSALVGWSAGAYHNSLYRTTAYVAGDAEVTAKITPSLNIGVGVEAGLATGYNKSVIPSGQVYAKIEKEFAPEMAGVRSVFLKVGVIPAMHAGSMNTPAVATAKVGISF